ncbi:DUF4240 domain-containing protein [Glutamicibacter protophormiae]|uniref:DUF4240 domain-containing protein n=1 Tax=Glutamicibacter protophormiae TaxID=37930 RepID=UPI00333214C4
MRTSTLAAYLSTVDHGNLIYNGYSAIDLKNLAELGPLWSVGVYYAKVTSLPAGYDWSPVTAVGFRWHECWVPVLRRPQINDIWIFNATQDALSTLDRKLTNKDAPGVLELVRPRISACDSWFMPYFEADRVGIVRCPEVDFAGAGAFGRIERLEFSEVSRVRNLAHFSDQGELNLLVLDNIEIPDPKTFWDIQAQRIVVRGYGKNLRWLYKIWPDRPDDWADRVRLGERLAADLDPEGRSGNLFEGYYEPVVEGDSSAQEADIEATTHAREEITEQRFWHIIGRARESCDGDAEGLAEALREELRQSTQQEIVAFDRLFALKTHALYSWELWGVAYLLLGGCGDDEFTDVRTWVVAQGRDFYHSCLADPTLLGNGQINDPAVVMNAEEIRYVPEEIFMEMTGTSIEEQYRDQPSASMAGQAPAGMPWDEYIGGLEARFPRIRALEGL